MNLWSTIFACAILKVQDYLKITGSPCYWFYICLQISLSLAYGFTWAYSVQLDVIDAGHSIVHNLYLRIFSLLCVVFLSGCLGWFFLGTLINLDGSKAPFIPAGGLCVTIDRSLDSIFFGKHIILGGSYAPFMPAAGFIAAQGLCVTLLALAELTLLFLVRVFSTICYYVMGFWLGAKPITNVCKVFQSLGVATQSFAPILILRCKAFGFAPRIILR